MLFRQKVALSMAAASIFLWAFGLAVLAQSATSPPAPFPSEQSYNNQAFLGTWHDDQNRFWFTVDAIVENEVQAARFWLAHLKSGIIEDGELTLVSESCVPLFGCYEYTHVARMIGLEAMDMFGHSARCVFNHGCRDEGDVVNHILMRK